MRSLRDMLVNDFGLGASLAGWTLTAANDISADGQFIVGSGTNPNGNTEAWLARLAPALSGDFNNDGTVDAADYVVWRKNDRTQTGYDTWRAHFGNTVAADGSSAGLLTGEPPVATVPEPATLTLVLLAAGLIGPFARRPAARPHRYTHR